MTVAKLANVIGVFGNQLPSPNQMASRCIIIQVMDNGEFHIKSVEHGAYRTLTVGVPAVLTGLQISGNTTVSAGSTSKLHAHPIPQEASTGAVTWSSSDTSVFTVDSHTGVITGVKAGSSVVHVESNGITAQAPIVIEPPALTGITATTKTSTVKKGSTAQLKVTPVPATASLGTVVWTSNADHVVSTTASGLVTGLKVGSAVLTATDNGFTDTVTVNVTAPALTALVLPTGKSVVAGKTLTMSATPTPIDAPLGTVKWTSNHKDIATINANTGIITGVKVGSVTITATSGTITKTTTVTITAPALTSFTVAAKSVVVGAKATMVATPVPTGAAAGTIAWTSATPAVASVNPTSGEVTGIKAGTSVVTATSGGKTGHATVTVTAPVLTGFTVADKSVDVGAKVTMAAVPVPAGAPAGTVKWSSATPANATVNSNTGEVTGVKAGTSVITATSGGKTGTGTVTVTASSPH